MRLDKLLLLLSAFLALVIACRALKEASWATAQAHIAAAEEHSNENNWPRAVERYTLAAETYAWDATLLQKYDAVNAIMAYKYAASVYCHIAVIAQEANMLTEAIDACKQEAQLCRQAAQLCRQASNIKYEPLLHALVASACARAARIYALVAYTYNDSHDPIVIASIWIMTATAYMNSANWFGSASDMYTVNDMCEHAAAAFSAAASIFQDAKCFGEEANAWMQVAEANTLSACAYRQIGDTLNEAVMSSFAARNYMDAVKAYKNADNDDGVIEAYQQAVTRLTIAAQIYHDAQDHEREARQYTAIAHLHLILSRHAQVGAAFELGGQAYQRTRDYNTAVIRFQEAEEAYAAANDPIAVQRVQSAIVACDLMIARNLYDEAVRRLIRKRTALTGQTELHTSRSNLLQDSYCVVMALESTKAQSARYKIVFEEEEANDCGGPLREWFSLLVKEMISPEHAYFVSRNPGDQAYQPNPNKKSPDDLLHYHFFGRVLAMAINSGNLIHFRLTDALLKHMLQQPVAFATNYYPTRQIQAQWNAFLDGFRLFVHRDCIKSLNTRALTWLINGEPTLSVDDWEHNTLYEHYSATSMPVVWFWNTVRSFSPEQHAKLLHFATGSSLVPLGGFSKLDPKFTIAEIEQGEGHVPSAATCFRKLYLPNYSTQKILRDKLLYAIEEGRGSFGFV